MDNEERLQKLKKLQVTDQNESAFYYRKVLIAWIANVAPLLKYDPQHYNTFMKATRTAIMPLSSKTITYHLNIARSVVDQAIIELENNIVPNKTSKPTSDIANNKDNPLAKSKWGLKAFAFSVAVIVFAAVVIWVINHYFPFLNL